MYWGKARIMGKEKEKHGKIKEAMNQPIPPRPAGYICEYEKLIEQNIQEREETMENLNYLRKLFHIRR